MLGVVIGIVSAVSLLVFLQKDPQAVKQNRQQKQKREEEHQAMLKKAMEEQAKRENDPALIAKKLQRKNEMKEKMFKTLTEQERKLLDQYINDKKNAGKSQEQIMKEAGAKAMLFCLLMILITVAALIGIFIILNGDVDKVAATISEVIQLGREFLQWNFPRMAANPASAANVTSSGEL